MASVGELDPGHPRPDDDDMLGHTVEVVAVACGEHPLPVDRRPVGHPGLRAGGDERLVEGDPPLSVDGVDGGGVVTDEATGASDLLNPLVGEQFDPVVVDVGGD